MKENIHINIQEVRHSNYTLPSLIGRLDNCEKDIAVMKWRLPEELVCTQQVREELDLIRKELETVKDKIENLYYVTNMCMEQYAEAERQIDKRAQDFE